MSQKRKKLKKTRITLLATLVVTALAVVMPYTFTKNAWGHGCGGCPAGDVNGCIQRVRNNHQNGRNAIDNWTAAEFNRHRVWMTTTFLINNFIPALQRMTEQLSALAMQQTFIIGTFFDAKHQLETQKLFQELQFQAHKDYQPSESFCTFGTAVRSMAHTESAARMATLAMSRRQMLRHMGNKNVGGSKDAREDKKNRWEMFAKTYCDPRDNNFNGSANSGLTAVCKPLGNRDTLDANTEYSRDRINLDIDYTRLIENRRTLDLYGGSWWGVGDELDVMSLGNNLYGHDVLTRDISESNAAGEDMNHRILKLRSIAAKRSVAETSFNSIVGLNSQGSTGLASNTSETNKFLGRILQDLGIPAEEVVRYIGLDDTISGYIGNEDVDASYFATLEILAKKIYQNPSFYANLYDTPANIKRKSAALKAIELMLDRAIFESQLRQEMSMSVLLSSRLAKYIDEFNTNNGDAE